MSNSNQIIIGILSEDLIIDNPNIGYVRLFDENEKNFEGFLRDFRKLAVCEMVVVDSRDFNSGFLTGWCLANSIPLFAVGVGDVYSSYGDLTYEEWNELAKGLGPRDIISIGSQNSGPLHNISL